MSDLFALAAWFISSMLTATSARRTRLLAYVARTKISGSVERCLICGSRYSGMKVAFCADIDSTDSTAMVKVRQASARTIATLSESNSTTKGMIRSILSSSDRCGRRLRKRVRPCSLEDGQRQFLIEEVTRFKSNKAGPAVG